MRFSTAQLRPPVRPDGNASRVRAVIVLGTRPEVVKLAPVIQACRARAGIEPIVCATGQHVELLDVGGYFDIRPDETLDVMRPGQTLAALTARLLTGIDQLIVRAEPDCVVVQGDTASTAAGALAAFYRQVPVVHVEAGLRTGDLSAPFPEELNRRLTSLAAVVHCCPTDRAADALRAEGVNPRAIHVTGNTVVDALLATVARERLRDDHYRARFPQLQDWPLVLVTTHRRENHGRRLEAICHAITRLAGMRTDAHFLVPVHPNPIAAECLRRHLSGIGNLTLTEAASYPEFVWLMARASVILTDSGGVQEEAPSLGTPVLVLREKTERPEAIDCGAATLVGTDPEHIIPAMLAALDAGKTDMPTENPFGDGNAAGRIADLIESRTWERST